MSPLEAIIRAEIATAGPMTVARYMELCLAHPQYGYYRTRDPLGTAGDFTTAPEISQMFGEMLGVWVAHVWDGLGRPGFRLVELGPGRGTLMADMLRVVRRAGAEPEIWLVETSPSLRAAQARSVPGANWTDRPDKVPEGPAIIVANEFLDALPVREFIRGDAGWHERLVGLRDGSLAWGLSEPLPPVALAGDWAESSAVAEGALDWIAARLSAGTSAVLLIDYGYRSDDRPAGPTLQAVRDHQKTDPLTAPGMSDLTWLVDFDHIARRLGARVATQGGFLAALGIGERAAALARAAPDRAGEIADQLERLTAPKQMGTLFKVAGAVSGGLHALPGFAEK